MKQVKIKIEKTVKNYISPEAKRLKEFRKAENLTLKEMGVVLGKDQAMVSRYENGEFTISIDVIKILNEKLQMSFEWFFHGKGNRKIIPTKSNLITDVGTLATNQALLEQQMEGLKKELFKLHNAFHAKNSGE